MRERERERDVFFTYPLLYSYLPVLVSHQQNQSTFDGRQMEVLSRSFSTSY